MTENELRRKVVEQAESWYGCKESDGSHKKIIDLYNSKTPLPRGYKVQYDDEWCATYVSAVGIACGISDIIFPECSCNQMISLHKKAGTWVEDDRYRPDIGDILMYDWNDSGKGDNTGIADHVGIVVSVENAAITVIEGNKGNGYVGHRVVPINGKYIRGYCVPNYSKKCDSEKPDNETEQKPKPSSKKVNCFYRVKTQKYGWLDEVKNLEDYAGWKNDKIVGLMVKVDKGFVKYRVHVVGRGWLPFVTGYNKNDYVNGYAGNDDWIDAIEIYYSTPDDIRPYKKAKYRVSPQKKNYYDWQYDNEKTNGQDGYAGSFGKPIDRVQICIV